VAIPKKGSRLISVDHVVYRWKVRHKPSYEQGRGHSPLSFAVERTQEPGSVLVVQMPSARLDNWMALPGKPVLPALVEQVIRTALTNGWRPDRPGHPFTLNAS
jgi:hypothetical protein